MGQVGDQAREIVTVVRDTAMTRKRRTSASYLAVGQIVAPHGIRGEVKVEIMTDFLERYRPGTRLFLGRSTDDPDVVPVEVATSRPHQGRMLVRLASVSDRNAAELLRGLYLLVPEEEAMPLGEHENYVHDLIGLQVETDAGQVLGELVEVLFTPANDVYVVQGPSGEVLIPARREVVVSVNLAGRVMRVALPDGLLSPVAVDAEP